MSSVGEGGGGGMDTTPLFTYPANSGFSRPDATLCTNMCLSTVILLGTEACKYGSL